ncbi:MAG: hypothetical protein AAGD10_16105 [Myxococcota bacterium]
MSTHWGDAPQPEVVAELLGERHGPFDKLEVDLHASDPRGLSAHIDLGARRTTIDVRFLRGPSPDAWLTVADALDALLGSWLESGRDHRALPTGEDVEFQEAMMRVRVEQSVPELERIADQLLEGGPKS